MSQTAQLIGDLALPLARAAINALPAHLRAGVEPESMANALRGEGLWEDNVAQTVARLGEVIEQDLCVRLCNDVYNRLLKVVRDTLGDLLMQQHVQALARRPVAPDAFLEMAYEDRYGPGAWD